MEGKLLARVGAIALVAIAITVAVVEATRKPAPTVSAPAIAQESEGAADPLRHALRRCQALGADAADDPECLRVWAENRRRFFRSGEER